MIIDQIKLGPISIELHDAVRGGLVVCTSTASSGTFSMGVATTREEWDEASRFAGMRGGDDSSHTVPISEQRDGFGGIA